MDHKHVKFTIFFMVIIILITKGGITSAQDKVADVLQKSYIWAAADTAGNNDLHVVFRNKFNAYNNLQKVTISLFAYNRFTLFINGKYVTRGPMRFENKHPEYCITDITPFVIPGQNTLAVIVHRYSHSGRIMNHQPGFSAVIAMSGKNGTNKEIVTNATWKAVTDESFLKRSSAWSSIRENIDARKMPAGYTGTLFDDSDWRGAVTINSSDTTRWAKLYPENLPPLRETPLRGVMVDGKPLTVRLPLTMNGGDSATVSTPAYTQAYVSFDLDADPDASLLFYDKNGQLRNSYLARAGKQTYTTDDTYSTMGFYIKVISGHVRLNGVRLVERLYPFTQLGSFTSNDTALNHIYSMLTRSLQILSEDAYVDCAERERVEWMDNTPPAFDVTRVAMAGPDVDGKKMYADARLLKEMLLRTAYTQQPDGRVKAHTVSDRWDIHAYMEDRACDWIEGLRVYYESTSDKALVAEIWKPVMLQLQWFLDHRTERGLVKAREWVIWGNPMGYQTCEGTALNAFIYKAMVDAAYLGKTIGKDKDAIYLKTSADQLYGAINKYLWDNANGTYYAGHFDDDTAAQKALTARHVKLKYHNGYVEPTFHAALFGIDQGVVPLARMDSVKRFMMDKRKGGYTIMAYYYLFRQMYQENSYGMDTEVLDMMREKWRPMLSSKWQVSWEGFNGGGSNAHIYGIYPPYFLSSYVLGVRLNGPVWNRKLIIEPHLGDLKSASGIVVTEFGTIPITWLKSGKALKFDFIVPEHVSASLQFPNIPTAQKLVINGKPIVFDQSGKTKVSLAAGKYEGTLN